MKLILLDVDGTLISYNGVIPQSVYTACQLAHQKGNLIYLVTGRTFGHLEEHIMKINPDGVIGGNGAFIKVEDKFIKSVTMNPQDQKEIVDYLLKKGNEFFIETTNSIYGSKGFPQKMQEVFAKYGHKGKKEVSKVYPMMTFPDELYFNDVTKINFILNDYQDYLDVKELFPNLKVSTWGGKGEEALFGDAGILGIDKKSAILQLQKYLNIPISSTVAFGDSEVDIPMFECANDSVAMGEARLAAKEAATFVTDDVEKNGLYNAFEKLNLI